MWFGLVQIEFCLLQTGQSAQDVASLVDAVAAAAPEFAIKETGADGSACLRINRSADASSLRLKLVELAAESRSLP